MAYIDVFNGDADGICSLVQLRNAHRVESELVTGVKRDIELLVRVRAGEGDDVTVLDVSMDKNKKPLVDLLSAGARVSYFDHHFAGEIPTHPNLLAKIDESPDVCTSCLVNAHLGGRFIEWAIVGAFGDNLKRTAEGMARSIAMSEPDAAKLEALGTYLNYNGYGPSEEDLHFRPEALYRLVAPHASPFAFLAESPDVFAKLESGYGDDMNRALTFPPVRTTESTAVLVLPDEGWARRVSGVFGNDLANAHPSRAHAVLTPHPKGGYVVSVRAPLTNKVGADVLCRSFPSGGGRAAAAGINHLPTETFDAFCDAFEAQYGTR